MNIRKLQIITGAHASVQFLSTVQKFQKFVRFEGFLVFTCSTMLSNLTNNKYLVLINVSYIFIWALSLSNSYAKQFITLYKKKKKITSERL